MSQNKPYTNLSNFLKRNKTIKEKNTFTHTALGLPPDSWPGSYCIQDSDKDTFFKLYEKHVFQNKFKAHLTERHRNMSPILIDLDLRHALQEGNNSRKYDLEFIKKFLGIYLEEIKKLIVVPSEQQYRYNAYVMEKKNPVPQTGVGKSPVLKDGIHIVFPFLVTEPKLQYIFRYNTITNSDVVDLFKSIDVINPIEDIFDIAVIERNNWQMYGSCKPNHEAYKVTYILDDELNKTNLDAFSNMDLVKNLSIRYYDDGDIVHIDEDKIEYVEEQHSKIPKQQQQKKPKRIMNKKKKSPAKKNFIDEDDLLFVRKLVKILKPSRAESYDSWIRMGWCLHNIDYRLLEDWVDFSKQSEKFVEGECEKEWCDMENEGLGMGTLFMWAREDNLAKYNQLSSENLRKCMADSLTLEPNDIAKVVYHMYKHDFVCFNAKKNYWYQFKDHRWIEIDDSVDLKKKFSTEVVNEYMKYRSHLSNKAYDVNNNGSAQDQKNIEDKIAIINKVISNLKKTSFKKNLNTECVEMFHDAKFEEKLDTNVNLIGFENGIYDLDLLEFRNGLPEDFVSFSTGINYIEYDDEDDYYNDVVTFTEQVLPKPHIREYVLTLLSSFLSGKTHNEKFHIWTGSGGNGKSKLVELFENGFRDYCCKLPVTLLTQQRARAEAANPALVRTKGKRFACLQEPDKHEEIQVGLMKELTGGDKIIARGLHKDSVEFKPQFKMVMTCNDKPSMSGNDRGTWRRVSVVEFISEFVDDPDPNNPYQFKIDEDLNQKLNDWPEAFIYLLLSKYFPKYLKDGLREPTDIKKNTEDYQVETDMFIQFFNEKIVELDNCNGKGLKIDDIYFVYGEWFKQAKGQGAKVPSRKDLQNNLAKRYGSKVVTSGKTTYMGIGFKDIVEED